MANDVCIELKDGIFKNPGAIPTRGRRTRQRHMKGPDADS